MIFWHSMIISASHVAWHLGEKSNDPPVFIYANNLQCNLEFIPCTFLLDIETITVNYQLKYFRWHWVSSTNILCLCLRLNAIFYTDLVVIDQNGISIFDYYWSGVVAPVRLMSNVVDSTLKVVLTIGNLQIKIEVLVSASARFRHSIA